MRVYFRTLLFIQFLFLIAHTDNSSVRSNALFVLGDMCVRYTNLVDRHIGVLAACLQVHAVYYTVLHCVRTDMSVLHDFFSSFSFTLTSVSVLLFIRGHFSFLKPHTPLTHIHTDTHTHIHIQDTSVLVRKHALILLTQLLLQDYIKWRGLLLFRFLATAVGKYVRAGHIIFLLIYVVCVIVLNLYYIIFYNLLSFYISSAFVSSFLLSSSICKLSLILFYPNFSVSSFPFPLFLPPLIQTRTKRWRTSPDPCYRGLSVQSTRISSPSISASVCWL
jgi:hypothetical protein